LLNRGEQTTRAVTGSGGRLHFGMVAGIKSERWPTSNRNPWPDCVGIRIHRLVRASKIVEVHPSGLTRSQEATFTRKSFRCWLRRGRADFDPPYREATSATPANGARAEQPRRGRRSRSKAQAASMLRVLTGEERNSSRSHCARDGHRFESPQLHHEVGASRPSPDWSGKSCQRQWPSTLNAVMRHWRHSWRKLRLATASLRRQRRQGSISSAVCRQKAV
jgi:hypothetical protein